MTQLNQTEYDYLFLRLANDIARSNKTYSRRELATEACRQMANLSLRDARALVAETKKDLEILYSVYQLTITNE